MEPQVSAFEWLAGVPLPNTQPLLGTLFQSELIGSLWDDVNAGLKARVTAFTPLLPGRDFPYVEREPSTKNHR